MGGRASKCKICEEAEKAAKLSPPTLEPKPKDAQPKHPTKSTERQPKSFGHNSGREVGVLCPGRRTACLPQTYVCQNRQPYGSTEVPLCPNRRGPATNNQNFPCPALNQSSQGPIAGMWSTGGEHLDIEAASCDAACPSGGKPPPPAPATTPPPNTTAATTSPPNTSAPQK